jgi:pimeloyl-ACP methyl ester carboxylesterase
LSFIRRRFLDLLGRQIHYRHVEGPGTPLIILHLLPGASRQMEGLMRSLDGLAMFAPDMAGTGDSDLHPLPAPRIADYTADLLAMMDSLGLSEVDLYGVHTGSCIAAELAVLAPHRVRRVVLEGVGLFEPAEAADLAAHYVPLIEPDQDGLHLLRVHNFCRDQILFWPWFERTAAARRITGLPPAGDLHVWVMEVLKGLAGFPLGYRAAFAYDMAGRLPCVTQPALCISNPGDTLAAHSQRAVGLLPNGELCLGTDSAGFIRAFLSRPAV